MRGFIIEKFTDLKKEEFSLRLVNLDIPNINESEILIKVSACGVCHTELDEIEGRIKNIKLPVIPGHEVVGFVESIGKNVENFKVGDRVGVGWIYHSCGKCEYCKKGKENLCINFKATGKDYNGGYAEYMKANKNFAYHIPEGFNDVEAAPLLCAGGVGYRSLKLTGIKDNMNLGFSGFGASAHIVMKTALNLYKNLKVFVFARSKTERELAKNLGAKWTGDFTDNPPEKLDAIIDTTPVWNTVLVSLKNLKPSGRLIINAIRKEEIDKENLLNLKYEIHLWEEKEIKTVANITRADISEFLKIAEKFSIKPEIEVYPFEKANEAILDIKNRKIKGAKVLKIL